MIDLAVVIPFYNESKILESFLDSLNNELKILDENILIVFIDDSSNDNSSHLISRFSFNSNVSFVILRHLVNSGSQQALKTGLRHLSKIASDNSYISSIVKYLKLSIVCFLSQGHSSLSRSMISTSLTKALALFFIVFHFKQTYAFI